MFVGISRYWVAKSILDYEAFLFLCVTKRGLTTRFFFAKLALATFNLGEKTVNARLSVANYAVVGVLVVISVIMFFGTLEIISNKQLPVQRLPHPLTVSLFALMNPESTCKDAHTGAKAFGIARNHEHTLTVFCDPGDDSDVFLLEQALHQQPAVPTRRVLGGSYISFERIKSDPSLTELRDACAGIMRTAGALRHSVVIGPGGGIPSGVSFDYEPLCYDPSERILYLLQPKTRNDYHNMDIIESWRNMRLEPLQKDSL